ncbi:MAG: hypothetical protein HQL52_00965 [Magnetococcales bacterium]|nr:hypothetical protein [Magnetococcales bacterium]
MVGTSLQTKLAVGETIQVAGPGPVMVKAGNAVQISKLGGVAKATASASTKLALPTFATGLHLGPVLGFVGLTIATYYLIQAALPKKQG